MSARGRGAATSPGRGVRARDCPRVGVVPGLPAGLQGALPGGSRQRLGSEDAGRASLGAPPAPRGSGLAGDPGRAASCPLPRASPEDAGPRALRSPSASPARLSGQASAARGFPRSPAAAAKGHLRRAIANKTENRSEGWCAPLTRPRGGPPRGSKAQEGGSLSSPRTPAPETSDRWDKNEGLPSTKCAEQVCDLNK